mmetsp:Transcript_110957/g.237108  ORF Transcript_110957/g.237108 Transcript_110957/m.237108 type:complete len:235 (+) Transcript_110957:91-795(+)
MRPSLPGFIGVDQEREGNEAAFTSTLPQEAAPSVEGSEAELTLHLRGGDLVLEDVVEEALDLEPQLLDFGVERADYAPRRGTSVAWWESSTAGTLSEPDTYTEYTLDAEDTSVSSTRASTSCATTGTGSVRPSRRSARGFSVVVRGERSPAGLLREYGHGYRGRSVTRHERRMPSAAMRHRHPTHTPSRGPARRAPSPTSFHRFDVQTAGLGPLGLHTIHTIGRVREEMAGEGL